MAAPETPTDLSIVDEKQSPESAQSKTAGLSEDQLTSGGGRIGSGPQGASTETANPPGRGAPWWLVGVVAILGLLLFGQQYQRAAGLDARVTSLTEELLVADQRLQIAQSHISAHQAHLESVRRGVAELTLSLAGLQTLANQDPLMQPAAAGEDVNQASPTATESSAGSAEPSGSGEEGASEAAQSLQQGDGTPARPGVEDSRSIVHEIVGTPFSDF